ncbi:hypothetical protein ACFE04_003403 [Oxalis oulophora]
MALRSFGKMWEFDCKPDLLTYNAVLNVLRHEHVCMVDVTVYNQSVCMLTLAVYTQMMKSGVKANVVTYNILIDGLLKHDDFQSANNMYDLMTNNGISPDKFTYTNIISSLCRAKDLECALRNACFGLENKQALSPRAQGPGLDGDQRDYNSKLSCN